MVARVGREINPVEAMEKNKIQMSVTAQCMISRANGTPSDNLYKRCSLLCMHMRAAGINKIGCDVSNTQLWLPAGSPGMCSGQGVGCPIFLEAKLPRTLTAYRRETDAWLKHLCMDCVHACACIKHKALGFVNKKSQCT